MSKQTKKHKSWIQQRTGKDYHYWHLRIGGLIGKTAKPGKTNKEGCYHDECDPLDWLVPLAKELMKPFPGGYRDENMWLASVLSISLMGWFVNLIRAKAYDPRRRLVDRKMMLKVRSEFCQQIMQLITDESNDGKMYPNQKWDFPYSISAKDGDYR